MQMHTDFCIPLKYCILRHDQSFKLLETSLIGKALDFGPRYYRFESCVSKFIFMNAYSNFLNQFLLCSFQQRLYAELRLTSRAKQLANLFLSLNLLRRIHKVNSVTWRLFPSYTKKWRCARDTRVYNLTSSKKNFSLRALRLLNLNYPFSYYILETNQGIMTHKTAIKRKIGGFLICVVL